MSVGLEIMRAVKFQRNTIEIWSIIVIRNKFDAEELFQ